MKKPSQPTKPALLVGAVVSVKFHDDGPRRGVVATGTTPERIVVELDDGSHAVIHSSQIAAGTAEIGAWK